MDDLFWASQAGFASLFIVILPLLTAIAFIVLGKLQSYGLYSITAEPVDHSDNVAPSKPKGTLLGVDARLPLFTLIFCIAFGFMYSIEVFPATIDNPGNAFQFIAFRGFTALTLFVISLTPLVSHISTVFVGCLSLMAAGVLTLTVQVFTGTTQTLGAILIAAGYAGFDALIWTLIGYYGSRSKKTAVKIIALVIGAEQVGIFAGNLLGSSVIAHEVDVTLFIAFMYLFLLAAFGLTQLSSKVLGESESVREEEDEKGAVLAAVPDSPGAGPAGADLAKMKANAGGSGAKAEGEGSKTLDEGKTKDKAEEVAETAIPATKSPTSTPPALQAFIREYGLTNREQEILVPFSEGRSVPYIAKTLFLSENTVKSHLRHIYTKCEVHNKQALLDLLRSYEK